MWFLVAVGAVVAALRRAALQPVRVSGDSMLPTLPDGSLVAVGTLRRDPGFGAVVLVRRPDGGEHVKRVIGTPGERVMLMTGMRLLGADEFAVVGDNRARSTDSRHYGAVARGDIVALARFCYWPPRSWRRLPAG